MIKLFEKGVFFVSNNEIIVEEYFIGEIKKEEVKKGIIVWFIFFLYNMFGNMDKFKIKFDLLVFYDIIFVGIVQIVKVFGMECFLLLYVLINCYNLFCVVGGIINGDDYVFGLLVVQCYGGIFVFLYIVVIY